MKRLSFPGPVLVLTLVLTLVVCFFVLSGSALAVSSWRTAETDDPAKTSWRDGLRVWLPLDSKQCRKAYGKNWTEGCNSASMGKRGRLAKGVRLLPDTPGEWRWAEYGSLLFVPASGSLSPDTTYTVDLTDLVIPQAVSVEPRVVFFTTQPQAVSMGRENVWIDPSADEAHGLSIPLSFIWPADKKAMEKAIRLTPAVSGLRLADMRFAWNPEGDQVVVSARIARLPETAGRIDVDVVGLPSCTTDSGRRIIRGQKAHFSFGVPGRNTLFRFRNISIQRGHDANLDVRNELVLETTLHVNPKDLLSHLTVVELPEKAEPGADKPTDWTKYPSIGMADLMAGTRLSPVLLSPPEASNKIRLGLPLQAQRCVAVLIDKKLAATSGVPLQDDVSTVLRAPESEAELSFLLPGNLVSLAGSKRIALHGVGLDSVRWKARRIQTSFLALFAAQHGFSSEHANHDEDVSLDSLTITTEGVVPVPQAGEGKAAFPVLDLASLLPPSACGLYQLEVEGLCKGEVVASAEKMILLTNMGLVVKENADGSRNVFVASLFAGSPVADARVRLLAQNGTTLFEADTNAQGMAYLPPAAGLEGEHKPVAITAESRGTTPDLSWMSLQDPSRLLDTSEYSLTGRHGTSAGLLASVFPSRGIYMPGETLHFGVLVRRFDWQVLPPNLPLEALITDPLGRTVYKRPLAGDPSLAEVSWKSSPQSPTGTYRLSVRVVEEKGTGPVLGSATCRVDEFEPDTLALSAELEPAPATGWIHTQEGQSPAQVKVHLRTLYGDDAAGHQVSATFAAQPARLTFPLFAGYVFQDASLPLGESGTRLLPDAVTDDTGSAAVALPADMARGTFQGIVRVEGFDAAGGRAVSREKRALFSPLEVVAGYRPVDGANTLDHIPQNAPAALHVIAVDNTLAPATLQNLTCTISQRRYVNSLVRDATGEFRYDAAPLTREIGHSKLSLPRQGAKIPLPSRTPGDYLLTLTQDNGTTLLSVPYTVAGKNIVLADGTSSAPLSDASLGLRLNKERYEPGETIVVRMNTPYGGTGLITIERENVAEFAWFRAEAGETEQRIRIPQTFEGQGYVTVLFARTSNSESIYLKPLTYASRPFECGMKMRDMGLVLKTEESVLPGRRLDVRLSAQRRGKALLFAVDEGVLSLTGYTTPDPLQDLLGNRALDVKTRQILDLLMPDHARLKGRLPAFGGDMTNPGGRFLNPFRRRSEPPFARWLGVVDVSSEEVVVPMVVPEYFAGSVRIMAVGSSSEGSFMAAGSAETSSKVRGSLILRPLLPVAASPGDVVSAAVTVANTIEGSGKNVPVSVKLTARDGTVFLRDGREETEFSRNLAVDESGEATIPFDLLVKDNLGTASVLFEAKLEKPGDKGMSRSFTRRRQSFSVRPLTLAYTSENFGELNGNTEVAVKRSLYHLDAQTRLTVTQAPIAVFRGVADKLSAYPFGCTEQTVSRAFPWLAALSSPASADLLFASARTDAQERTAREEQDIGQAFSALRTSLSDQGVSLWPGGEADDFVTVYAADFLLSLGEFGRGVPPDLRGNILEAVQQLATRDPENLKDARVRAYACWVLLRSGTLVTQEVERLHDWLKSSDTDWENDVTAALLADCYAMLRLESTAKELMPAELAPMVDGYSSAPLFNTGVATSLHACILQRPFWLRTEEDSELMVKAMTKAAEQALAPNASTTTMALTARALAESFAHARREEGPLPKILCKEYDPDFALPPQELTLAGLSLLDAPGCKRFVVQGDARSLVWHLAVSGHDRTQSPDMSDGMEVRRRYLDAGGNEVSEARAGDVLTVELSVRSDDDLDNVALVDLLPGGLEPLLEQPPLPSWVDRSERREDRMICFLSTNPAPRLVTYKVRAVTAGTFTIPAVHALSMYNPAVAAKVSGGTFTVKRR